jgi:hypothetical protein
MEVFLRIRNELLATHPGRFAEDLIDELNAVLIHGYPMPDFWSSPMSDFRGHVNFKRYFDLLFRSGH